METVIKPIKITRENFNEFGDLISSEGINSIDRQRLVYVNKS